MGKSLALLRAERREIDAELEAKFGEIDEGTEKALALSEKELAVKLDNYALYVQGLDQDAEVLKAHKKEVEAELKRVQAKKDWLLEGVKITLQQLDVKELKGTYFKFSLKQNPPRVHVLSEDQIPAQYIREKVLIEVDKKAISEQLKAGKEIAGARLIVDSRVVTKGI